ncbi:MAG: chemotaxis protein CheB [Desulfobacterales bacterium]|nr:chemotaxis protein CheB [Desulfobacterales bacterium]
MHNFFKNKHITLLIVNDSPLIIAVISAILKTEPNIKIVGTARTGIEGVEQTIRLKPDIILMDIHMPEMDGVTATKHIIEKIPYSRILITTATVTRNMNYIFDALNLGALDYIKSPSLPYSPGTAIEKKVLRACGEDLIKKLATIINISNKKLPTLKHNLRDSNKSFNFEPANDLLLKSENNDIPVVGIGCSTGGPKTLLTFFKYVPKSFPGTILICQHIEPGFDNDFAVWLSNETQFNIKIASDGINLSANSIYIAPAGKNLIVLKNKKLFIEEPKPKQVYAPSIDRLFSSMAENLGKNACGIIMTGMGNDGANGIKKIKENQGEIFIQSNESAIVGSMPLSARISTGIKKVYMTEELPYLLINWMRRILENKK